MTITLEGYPEQSLWVYVVIQAFYDAFSKNKMQTTLLKDENNHYILDAGSPTHKFKREKKLLPTQNKLDAINWFRMDNPDFVMTCNCAYLTPKFVMRKYNECKKKIKGKEINIKDMKALFNKFSQAIHDGRRKKSKKIPRNVKA